MTIPAPKHLLDIRLAQALRDCGLDAEAVDKRDYYADILADILADIWVQLGNDSGAVSTMPCTGPDRNKCLEQAIDSLLRRNDGEFAVAVCYPDDLASNFSEEARFAWRIKANIGAESGLMSGRVADLALTISLVNGKLREPGLAARTLAESLVQDDPDAIVVALPHFTATGASRIDVRYRLQRDHYILFIIASHDPEQECFSRDGKGPEVLVVCRPRVAVQAKRRGTRIVNLARNPANSGEARAVASDILKSIASRADTTHTEETIHEVISSELNEKDWNAVQFISPFLREQLLKLTSGGMFPSAKLSVFADVGPTGGTVRKAFVTERPESDTRRFIALWGHSSSDVQMMRPQAKSPVWAHPDPIKSVSATKHWEKRSHLLVPVAPYLPKARTMAVRLDKPTLGSMWTNVRIECQAGYEADYERALCVYMNSTLGILSMLGSFKRMDRLSRLESTARDLMALPVPDFVKMNGPLEALATAFDELGECELSPLPESNNCSVRRAIDDAVCEALGISEELIHRIRSDLVREPSITRDHYQIEERQLSFFAVDPKA